MKTTLDLPDELMTAVKVRAARQNRKMKDIIADALRRDLGLAQDTARHSVRDIQPVAAGEIVAHRPKVDRLGDMLDARGHRY